jgi:hypothetical protein
MKHTEMCALPFVFLGEADKNFSCQSKFRVLTVSAVVFLIILPLCILSPALVLALPLQDTRRTIVSDDFTKSRRRSAPSPRKSSQGAASNRTQRNRQARVYLMASTPIPNVLRKAPTNKVAHLGITIWRLRPVRANYAGARLLVREKGKSSELMPERVEADTIFREGDQVRLSIESPHVGYLYVIDRELFADGSLGAAMLIYPWVDMKGGDNRLQPGRLIDIPAQEDDPSYFTGRLGSHDQVGEVLTIIVTTTALDFPISDRPIRIPDAHIAKWEKRWAGLSERFEMEGGAGETWTDQEQQAAARSNARQLTREDPAPQTIYRIRRTGSEAVLVNIRLQYGK